MVTNTVIRDIRNHELSNANRLFSICLLVSFLLLSSPSLFSPIAISGNRGTLSIQPLKNSISNINRANLEKEIKEFSGFQTRVTGYPQFKSLTQSLVYKLRDNIGVPSEYLYLQNYSIVVPVDFNSKIILNDFEDKTPEFIECYAVWPNLFQPSKTINPISGPLVYGLDGSLEKLDGKKIKNAIVLLDFNSARNWINVADLGAKGVIFILPENEEGYPGSFDEAVKKFSLTPLYFPKVAVKYEDGLKLKRVLENNRSVSVSLISNMSLVEEVGNNVVVVIPGAEKPEEGIVVTTHCDTWSVVPALAHNQDEATNIAVLLELIRYYVSNPPKRTLIFVFLSGHWQAIAGAREFTDWLLFTNNSIIQQTKPLVLINLDLSTDANKVAFLYRGFMYDFGSSALVLRWTRWLAPKLFDEYIPNIKLATGMDFVIENGFRGDYGWWTTISGPYMLDSEPWAIAHGLSFTIRTSSSRSSWGLPNTKVNFENLWPQVTLVNGVIYQILNEAEIDATFQPMRYLFTAAGGDIAGFMTVQGEVVEFNVKRSWFTPVPKSIVVARRQGMYSSEYPFNVVIAIADENGTFTLHGISGYGYGHGYGRTDQWEFFGFHIDDETGMIDYAPDLGQYGRQFTSSRIIDRSPFPLTISTFRCSSLVLFDLVDVLRMAPKQFLDPRFKSSNIGGVSTWYSEPSQITVLSYVTLSEPIFWGFFAPPFENVGMAFVEPEQKSVFLFRLGPSLEIVATLTNSSVEYPEGMGYKAYSSGRQLNLNLTILRMLEDTSRLASSRYQKIKSSYVRNVYAEEDIRESEKYLIASYDHLENHIYSLMFFNAFMGLNYASHSYVHTMSVINDILNVDFLFMALFVAAAIFIERLLFSTSGIKRIFLTGILGILLFSVFYSVNPASRIVMSFVMLPLAVSIFMLLLFILVIFFSDVGELARTYRVKTTGQHVIEKPSSGSLYQLAFTHGSQNLRKRKLRTALVLLTVVSITFAAVAFTSSYAVPRISYSKATNAVPSYKGILISADPQKTPANIISQEFVKWIEALYPEMVVSPRVWSYPQSIYGQQVYIPISTSSNSYLVSAILGLGYDEAVVKKELSKLIVSGSYFNGSDIHVILIPYEAAKALNVGVNDYVTLGSYNLLVKGVYNSSQLNSLKDLDGYSILPANPSSIQSIVIGPVVSQGLGINFLSGEQVVIVPSELALKLGGYISSISIYTENDSLVENLSNKIPYAVNRLISYVCDGNEVESPVLALGLTFQGWANMMIPLAIGALIVLDTMIAGVIERTNEIKTYSAVGIDPLQISIIFISESLIYALISVVIGYTLGVIANILLLEQGVLPSNFIANTSSLPTALAVIIVLISTIISAMYPSRIASKLVTPSLERRWKIPTKSRGDEWAIPLPFSTKDLSEARGLLRFLREYLEAHTVESPERYIVTKIALDENEGTLSCDMALQPLEAGVTQKVEIYTKTLEARVSFDIKIVKLSGPSDLWKSANYSVVDSLRKQMLIWRSLSSDERKKYMLEGDM